MSTLEKLGTYSILAITPIVLVAAVFVIGTIIGSSLVSGELEISPIQFGIIGGGIASIFAFIRSYKSISNNAKHASL